MTIFSGPTFKNVLNSVEKNTTTNKSYTKLIPNKNTIVLTKQDIAKNASGEYPPKTLVFTLKPIRNQNQNIDSYGRALVKMNPDLINAEKMTTKEILNAIDNAFKDLVWDTNSMSKIEDLISKYPEPKDNMKEFSLVKDLEEIEKILFGK